MGNIVSFGAELNGTSPTWGQRRNLDSVQQSPDVSTFSYGILFIYVLLIN